MDFSDLDPNDTSGNTLELALRREYGDKAISALKEQSSAKGLTLRELVEQAVLDALEEASRDN